MACDETKVILPAQDDPVPDSLGKFKECFCSVQNEVSSNAERIRTSGRDFFLTHMLR
jgi:hypothetical protein